MQSFAHIEDIPASQPFDLNRKYNKNPIYILRNIIKNIKKYEEVDETTKRAEWRERNEKDYKIQLKKKKKNKNIKIKNNPI